MNSLIQGNPHLTNDHAPQLGTSSKGKLLNKTYSFFIFYKIITPTDRKLTSLQETQKLSFRLRSEANLKSDKYLDSVAKNQKNVNLIFANVEIPDELENSLIDLKFHVVENKTKIIFLGYESDLLKLIDKASQLGIDMKQVPFAIYSPSLNDDLALFLGWKQQYLGNIAEKTPDQLSILANQWISSPSQKIDVWQIHFKVKESGKISKLQYDPISKGSVLKQFQSCLDRKQYFMSHFSVGYHSKLFMQFQSNNKSQKQSSFFTKLKFDFTSFKKFCCVGNHSMKTSTGIVNISFKDEKNTQMQIMKEFYDHEVEGQFVEDKKYRQNRKVLSIVVGNIDMYCGQKVTDCRMNDGKVELLAFGAKKDCQKIGTIGGQIKLRFQTEQEVCLKIGDQVFVLEEPVQAIIKQFSKMKTLINKETVGC